MNQYDPNEINRLIGEFFDLQERWESDPQAFDWTGLQALAEKGAQAYNECCGPSFHALALDGVSHGEFHERFLGYSLQAGFDPFKLVRPGEAVAEIPVIDHANLADAALWNPVSDRMRAALMEVARGRFEPLAQDIRQRAAPVPPWLYRVIDTCAESVPLDLLEQIAPELAKEHHAQRQGQPVDPVEGYLSPAEVMTETNYSKPYG